MDRAARVPRRRKRIEVSRGRSLWGIPRSRFGLGWTRKTPTQRGIENDHQRTRSNVTTSHRADRVLRCIGLFWLLFVLLLVLLLVLSPIGRYSYTIPVFVLYHSVVVNALVGVRNLRWKVNQRPRRKNALQHPGSEYRTIARLLSTTSHRVRVRYAFASLIPHQIPRAPSSLTLLSQDSRNASVDMRIGPIAVIRTLLIPTNCMVAFFMAL